MTACITNRCSQGHAPCPTPGVCNGNTHPALPIQYAPAEEQRDAAEHSTARAAQWPATPNTDGSVLTPPRTSAAAESVVKWVLAGLCLFALVAALSAAAGYLSAGL